jgi:hypothetical protein
MTKGMGLIEEFLRTQVERGWNGKAELVTFQGAFLPIFNTLS